MIDFSQVKSITLPPPSGDSPKITLIKNDLAPNVPAFPCVWVIVDGQTYYGDTTTPTVIPVSEGTKVVCCRITEVPGGKPDCTLNGVAVGLSDGGTYTYYEYTVKGNTTIEIEETNVGYNLGVFKITATTFTGVVKQIADESGRVLWSAGPPMAVITINCSSEHSSGTAYVQIDGTTYNQNSGNATIEVPIGTTIVCGVQAGGSSSYGGTIYLNGTQVASGYSNTYTYSVNGNVTIRLENDRVNDFSGGSSTPTKKDYCYVYITET